MPIRSGRRVALFERLSRVNFHSGPSACPAASAAARMPRRWRSVPDPRRVLQVAWCPRTPLLGARGRGDPSRAGAGPEAARWGVRLRRYPGFVRGRLAGQEPFPHAGPHGTIGAARRIVARMRRLAAARYSASAAWSGRCRLLHFLPQALHLWLMQRYVCWWAMTRTPMPSSHSSKPCEARLTRPHRRSLRRRRCCRPILQ